MMVIEWSILILQYPFQDTHHQSGSALVRPISLPFTSDPDRQIHLVAQGCKDTDFHSFENERSMCSRTLSTLWRSSPIGNSRVRCGSRSMQSVSSCLASSSFRRSISSLVLSKSTFSSSSDMRASAAVLAHFLHRAGAGVYDALVPVQCRLNGFRTCRSPVP